jgi:hypothetical protein
VLRKRSFLIHLASTARVSEFWGLNCAKSRPNFYDAERLLPFGFATCALAPLASRPMIAARQLFGLTADPAVTILINLIQPGY